MVTGATNYAGESFTQFENLVTGAGDDRITGTADANRIYTYDGNDTVDGGTGNDYIHGGNGNDSLVGGGGRDTIYGGAGNDVIRSSGQGVYDGQGGNDIVYAGLGTPETLRGGAGTDMLDTTSFSGDYRVDLASGATNYAGESFIQFENLRAGSGDDTLLGTNDRNVMQGGNGDDRISGRDGNDSLYGQNGDDYLGGGSGNDYMRGGNDNDRMSGHGGNDRMYGDAGNDWMAGQDGDDLLNGGLGDDTLSGGAGDDVLIGSTGRDVMTGGSGEDVFRFYSTSDSPFGVSTTYDRITDFQGAGINFTFATEDKIDLSSIDANVNLAGNQAFVFTGTTSGGAGTIWMQDVGGETWLRVNTDSDSTPEMTVRIVDGTDTASDYWAGDFVL